MSPAKGFDTTRSASSARRKPERYGIIGMLAGTLLGLLVTYARVGLEGLIWLRGKGGETFLTTTGRIIVSILVVVGAFAGGLCGVASEARGRTEVPAAKPRSEVQQEHLWDRQLDEGQ
jgi:hypothetical protein